jgi:general secretion pathway protein I
VNKLGVSIIEAVVALAILSVALAAVTPAFISFSQVNTKTELKSGAVAAAQQVLDGLRQQAFTDWPSALNVDAGSRRYDVGLVVCSAGTAGCLSSNNARHVRLEVRYGGKSYYTVETVLTKLE